MLKYANEVKACQYRHRLTVHVNADQTNIVTQALFIFTQIYIFHQAVDIFSENQASRKLDRMLKKQTIDIKHTIVIQLINLY